jgi:hypothetical protein
MKIPLAAAALVLLAGSLAQAHRLDEYLQGTIISVEKNRVDAQLTLTPGVAVFPIIRADIDTDGDGVISRTEQQAYARRVLEDMSLSIDGRQLTPQLRSIEFPAMDEMNAGSGEIRMEFSADLPRGGRDRKLIFENHHESRIAAYQVNCLVPRDPDIRIVAQNRNYFQSFYELDFVQTGGLSSILNLEWLPTASMAQGTATLLLVAALSLIWRRRARFVRPRA